MGLSKSNPVRSLSKLATNHFVRAVGGSTAITKTHGPGLTVTRTGTGAYAVTFAENIGVVLAAVASLMATTRADVAGHTVVFAPYNTTTKVLAFTVYNAADAAHDLAALEWVSLNIQTSAQGLDT